MPYSIGPTIGVKGEKAFRAAFQEMISVSKRFDAELDQLTATFSKNDSAMDRSANKAKILQNAIQAQYDTISQATQQVARAMDVEDKRTQSYEQSAQKVRDLTEAHKEHKATLDSLVQKYGEGEECVKLYQKEYAEEEKQLNKATKALGENEAKMHRSRSTLNQWQATLSEADKRLYELQRELAKGTNYVEEFGRKSEDSKRKLESYNKEVQILDAEMQRTESTYDKWTTAIEKGADATENIKKKMEEERKILEENTKLRDEAIATEEKQRKEYEDLVKQLEKAKEEYGEDSREVKILSDAVEEQAKLVHEASNNTAEYTRAVIDSETALNNMNRELRNNSPLITWSQTISDVGESIEDFGDNLSKYVTTPLLALGTYATNAALDFEDGMAKIYTIAIDSTEPMEKMHDELMQLSADTGFGLDDLAEATYQTVSASVDATDAINFMTHATKLARAGFTTTEKSVDVLTTIMNSYGKETYDVQYISDVLLKTQNDGKLVIDELASSLGIIIPMASNYNVGLEQIAAAYATMTKQGVPAEKATTFLRAVFTELEKESSDVAEILKDKTGKSFAQLMADGNNLSDVLRILYNHAGNNAEEFQRLFGNVRATQAVASLVTDDFSILDDELERVTYSSGQTDKALEVLETTSLKAKRSVAQLKNSAVTLGESILDQAMPAIEGVTSKIKELTDKFSSLTPEATGIIVKMGAFAASIGPVAKITGKLVKYIAGLVLGTSSLIPVIGLVTAGVIGVATAIAVSNQEHMDAIKAEYGLSDAMKDELAELDALKTSHDEFKQSMEEKHTATLDEVAYMQELVGQYDALVGKDGEVSDANKATADFILGELANALGIEVSQVKELIDENGKLSDSIAENIAKYQEEATAAALKDEINEATHRKIEAERIEADIIDQLAVATQNQVIASREKKAAQEEINKAIEAGNPVTKEMSDKLADATAKEKLATNAVDDLRAGLAEAQEQIGSASSDIEYFTDKLSHVGDETKETTEEIKKGAKESEKAVKDAAENSGKALSDAESDARDAGYNFVKGFADSVDKYSYLGSNAASRLGQVSAKNLKVSLHEKSPSKLTGEIGEYFVEGFANPIEAGIVEMGYLAQRLGRSAASGLAYGSYMSEASNLSTNRTVSAPISINLTVNGNVDDPDTFGRSIADQLVNLINRETGVFA